EVWRLANAIAERYAGTRQDVLRLAIPPRHARVEGETWPEPEPVAPPRLSGEAWTDLQGGPALLTHLAAGHSPRAVWTALPGPEWSDAIAEAVAACLASGRGAVVVVPTATQVARVAAALERVGVPPWRAGLDGGFVTLQADDGPAPRYRAFLAALRGRARVVFGTRGAGSRRGVRASGVARARGVLAGRRHATRRAARQVPARARGARDPRRARGGGAPDRLVLPLDRGPASGRDGLGAPGRRDARDG